MPLGAMLPEPMGFAPSLPARHFHRRGFLKADEIQSRYGGADRGDPISFRAATHEPDSARRGDATERGTSHQHERHEAHEAQRGGRFNQFEAPPDSHRSLPSSRSAPHSARERSAMPGYGGHVPLRPWTIGRRHMGYGDPATPRGGGGGGGRALRGSGLGGFGFAGRPSPSRHYDNTEQSAASGRDMRKGGYPEPRYDPEPSPAPAREAPPTRVEETPPPSHRGDGGESARSGANTQRGGSGDDTGTRPAGRMSMIAREDHPDGVYMPQPAEGERYMRYQRSEQPRGKMNARGHFEATKQPIGGRMQQRCAWARPAQRRAHALSKRACPRLLPCLCVAREAPAVCMYARGRPAGLYRPRAYSYSPCAPTCTQIPQLPSQ